MTFWDRLIMLALVGGFWDYTVNSLSHDDWRYWTGSAFAALAFGYTYHKYSDAYDARRAARRIIAEEKKRAKQ